MKNNKEISQEKIYISKNTKVKKCQQELFPNGKPSVEELIRILAFATTKNYNEKKIAYNKEDQNSENSALEAFG